MTSTQADRKHFVTSWIDGNLPLITVTHESFARCRYMSISSERDDFDQNRKVVKSGQIRSFSLFSTSLLHYCILLKSRNSRNFDNSQRTISYLAVASSDRSTSMQCAQRSAPRARQQQSRSSSSSSIAACMHSSQRSATLRSARTVQRSRSSACLKTSQPARDTRVDAPQCDNYEMRSTCHI